MSEINLIRFFLIRKNDIISYLYLFFKYVPVVYCKGIKKLL
jgi:hypothetical protein